MLTCRAISNYSALGPPQVGGPACGGRNVLRLIKMWLKAPIEERDADGTRRMSGGKGNTLGTPQGGVASPLLANIYMNRFLKHWRQSGAGEAFRAHVVAYADDFVILSRGRAAEALTWITEAMTKLGLTHQRGEDLAERRPQGALRLPRLLVRSPLVQEERQVVPGREPVQEERAAIQDQGRRPAGACNVEPWDEVCDQLNSMLLGWSDYFSYGTTAGVLQARRWHVYNGPRLPRATARGQRARNGAVLLRCRLWRTGPHPPRTSVPDRLSRRGPAVKPVGEPDAGNRHVRFDERGEETEPRCGLRHRHLAKAAGNSYSPRLLLPRLSSTLPSRTTIDKCAYIKADLFAGTDRRRSVRRRSRPLSGVQRPRFGPPRFRAQLGRSCCAAPLVDRVPQPGRVKS